MRKTSRGWRNKRKAEENTYQRRNMIVKAPGSVSGIMGYQRYVKYSHGMFWTVENKHRVNFQEVNALF